MQTAVTQNHHQLPIQVNPHLVTFCTVAVFLYALTRLWIGAKISAYFEAAFLLPFYYIVFKNWWYFKKQFLTWLVIAMLAVPVLQFCVQYYQDPVLAMKYQGVDKLFRLTFFLAPAYWLAHNLKLVPWFIAANLVGFITLILIQPDLIQYINEIKKGKRASPSEINSAFLAMYAGIFWLLIPLLSTQLITKNNKKTAHILGLLTLTSIWLSLSIIIYSAQTRATILGLILSIIITLMMYIFSLYKRSNLLRTWKVLPLIVVMITITGIAAHKVYPKIASETDSLKPYLTGLSDKPAETSFGFRLELWNIAIDKTTNYPLLGMGAESRFDAILKTPNISKGLEKRFHHFHNSFFEFTVAYGLPGLVLLIAFLYKITPRKFSKKYDRNSYQESFIYLALFIFIITVNIFESYLFFWQGPYTLFIIFTPFIAIRYINKLLKKTKFD